MIKFLVVILLISEVLSHSEYQSKIPNGNNVYHLGQKWPGVGHNAAGGGGIRNPFGIDWEKTHEWTTEFCQLDSDNDGLTNGQELGDPECIWKVGDTPARDHDITHPGFPQEDLTDPDCKLTIENEKSVVFTFDQFPVPAEETNYMCYGFELPADGVYHAVKFKPIIDSDMAGEKRHAPTGFVHHMILYVCDEKQEMTEPVDCRNMIRGCSSVFYAWALGSEDFCLPEQVGMIFGEGEAQHVVLQIHYNNLEKLDNMLDSSGVEVVYTSTQREYSGGIVRLGADMNQFKIPPGKSSHEVLGICDESSTGKLPNDLNVAASILHMHMIGRKIWTSVFREGAEVMDLGKNENYDFNLQTFVKFHPPRVIKASDRLETHCVYDSSNRTDITKGGEASTDEMCFNFVLVYPRLPADSCIDKTINGRSTEPNIIIPVIGAISVIIIIVMIFLIFQKIRRRKPEVTFEY
jgi:dopamine beta-monooxygenase